MPRDCAKSPAHRAASVKAAMSKFLHTMGLMGLEYVDDGQVQVTGGLPHIEMSGDTTPDLGPLARPDPRDIQANEMFEAAEKARQGRNLGDGGMVDFRIVATFRKRQRKVLFPNLLA